MKRYIIVDQHGRDLVAERHGDSLRVTMIFYPEETLTIEEVCESMSWKIIEEQEYHKPEVVSLRKD